MIEVINVGSDHCVKLYKGGYEVSIAVENHGNSEIRVYRVGDNKNLTHLFSADGSDDICYTHEDLARVLSLIAAI